jgi:hypothetical protein
MSTKVLIEEREYQISLNWTAADLTAFWKKEKQMDPEARILSWTQQVTQGVAKNVVIPENGSLATHKVKEASRYKSIFHSHGAVVLQSVPFNRPGYCPYRITTDCRPNTTIFNSRYWH